MTRLSKFKKKLAGAIGLTGIFVCLFLLLSNCQDHTQRSVVIIEGNIRNLPDGTLYITEWGQEIDSVETKNGKFTLEIIKGTDFEPIYIGFLHISPSDSMRRIFLFDTKAKYKSKPMATSSIMLEENLLELYGELLEFDSPQKTISSSFKGDRELGIQTKVYLEDTVRFPTRYTLPHLTRMLDKHPYSYHVFFEFEKLIPSMSNKQALAFLSRFDDNIRNGNAAKRVENYIKSRSTKKLSTTLLSDVSNQQRYILQPEKRIHMVILWASWCGPCRKEIPQLKRIHKRFEKNPSFEMVSVSLDEDPQNWKKALEYEKMPWRQLIMNKEVNMFSKELFSFDGSIPTTLLVDERGEVIKKMVGYHEGSEEEIAEAISVHTGLK